MVNIRSVSDIYGTWRCQGQLRSLDGGPY